MREVRELCDIVRQTSFEIHIYLGHGHPEKVYENALTSRLRKFGLRVAQQVPIRVSDEDGTALGEYAVDILIEDVILVELKAAKSLSPEHESQILGYLKGSGLTHGMLINFGSYTFQIRKFIWTHNRQESSD